jgi:hypothetical protein
MSQEHNGHILLCEGLRKSYGDRPGAHRTEAGTERCAGGGLAERTAYAVGCAVRARARCADAASLGSGCAGFTDDPAVARAAMHLLLWIAVLQPLAAAAFTLDGVLIGASDTRFLAWSMAASSSVFVCLPYAAFGNGWGTAGLGAGPTCGWSRARQPPASGGAGAGGSLRAEIGEDPAGPSTSATNLANPDLLHGLPHARLLFGAATFPMVSTASQHVGRGPDNQGVSFRTLTRNGGSVVRGRVRLRRADGLGFGPPGEREGRQRNLHRRVVLVRRENRRVIGLRLAGEVLA